MKQEKEEKESEIVQMDETPKNDAETITETEIKTTTEKPLPSQFWCNPVFPVCRSRSLRFF